MLFTQACKDRILDMVKARWEQDAEGSMLIGIRIDTDEEAIMNMAVILKDTSGSYPDNYSIAWASVCEEEDGTFSIDEDDWEAMLGSGADWEGSKEELVSLLKRTSFSHPNWSYRWVQDPTK